MKKRSRRSVILITIVLVLIAARVAAPPFILSQLNKFLAGFSENYYAHIEDFDLSLWRGAYRFENVIVSFKKHQERPFLKVGNIDVSVAWRELFHGRILTDIETTNLQLVIAPDFAQNVKKDTSQSKDEAQDAGKKLFPIQAERIQLANSRIEYQELDLFIDSIEGTYSNATPTGNYPFSLLTIKGAFLGKSFIKIVGTTNQIETPTSWVVAAEFQRLPLKLINPLINRYVPMTFKEGSLDAYAEVKSEGNKITGYLKPFLKEASVMGDNKDFKGIKHFGVELTVAFINGFFQSTKNKTVATKVLFSVEGGKFQWNAVEAISELFAHGYQQELAPGIENILSLSSQKSQVKIKDHL